MFKNTQKITDEIRRFASYCSNIPAAAQGDITDADVLPILYVRGKDGTLVRQELKAFVEDFIGDPTALGWSEKLCGSPPKLVIEILRTRDVLKVPSE